MNGSLDHFVVACLANLCVAGAAVGCLYVLIAAFVAGRLGRGRPSARGAPTPATLLKPLHGDEPGLAQRLTSFCQQDYAAPVQIVFGCQDRADTAIAAVKRLQAAFPERALDLVVDARSHGENRKISNLINIAAHARHDILVASDSDIEVGPRYLAEVAAALEQPGVGAVTCLYHGVPQATLASAFSALSINAHFLPNVVVAIAFGLAHPCFGSTIALKRETLRRIGGFRAFADRLADDYMIGQAVREAGLRVAVSPVSLAHVCSERTFADFLRRQLRCARTIKSLDYTGYAGLIVTNPLPLALLGALDQREGALLLVAGAVAGRLALCKTLERALGLPRQNYWLLPAIDLVLFAVFVSSFFGSGVTWRGHRYRILSKGTLSQDSN